MNSLNAKAARIPPKMPSERRIVRAPGKPAVRREITETLPSHAHGGGPGDTKSKSIQRIFVNYRHPSLFWYNKCRKARNTAIRSYEGLVLKDSKRGRWMGVSIPKHEADPRGPVASGLMTGTGSIRQKEASHHSKARHANREEGAVGGAVDGIRHSHANTESTKEGIGTVCNDERKAIMKSMDPSESVLAQGVPSGREMGKSHQSDGGAGSKEIGSASSSDSYRPIPAGGSGSAGWFSMIGSENSSKTGYGKEGEAGQGAIAQGAIGRRSSEPVWTAFEGIASFAKADGVLRTPYALSSGSRTMQGSSSMISRSRRPMGAMGSDSIITQGIGSGKDAMDKRALDMGSDAMASVSKNMPRQQSIASDGMRPMIRPVFSTKSGALADHHDQPAGQGQTQKPSASEYGGAVQWAINAPASAPEGLQLVFASLRKKLLQLRQAYDMPALPE